MCARKGGNEDLTKEILGHFEAYCLLNPIIIQCDKEMSIIDVCTRERNARKVSRFAPKTSHQSNGFVEAVHGHIQGLSRCYQTQIETNTAYSFQQFHLPFHLQFVTLDLFSQDSLCDPTAESHSNIWLELHIYIYIYIYIYISPLCMFGESVFALIPNHEVRAAKTTNR